MIIAVVTDDALRAELTAQAQPEGLYWLNKPGVVKEADAYIDLCFSHTPPELEAWKKIDPPLLLVNAVTASPGDLPPSFVRINGWPGFLKRSVLEASCSQEGSRKKTEEVISLFHKNIEWVEDVAGFISPRVVSMIINEAYFALQEQVSDKENIDLAMKLGTHYPFGPFEWGKMIGLERVLKLLTLLAGSDPRYEPAALLKKEALAG